VHSRGFNFRSNREEILVRVGEMTWGGKLFNCFEKAFACTGAKGASAIGKKTGSER